MMKKNERELRSPLTRDFRMSRVQFRIRGKRREAVTVIQGNNLRSAVAVLGTML